MSELSPADAAELIRLTEYVAELRKLVAQHDRTLPRFRWYLTQRLWLDVRSMISNEDVESVRNRSLTERDGSNALAHQGSTKENDPEGASSSLTWFAKIELFGGPADGQVHYACLPLSATFTASAIGFNGRALKPKYLRTTDERGDVVALEAGGSAGLITHEALDKAFAAKRSTKYSFVPRRRRR